MEKTKIIGSILTNGYRIIKTVAALLPVNAKHLMPFGVQSNPYPGISAVRAETQGDDIVLGVIQKAYEGLQEGESVFFSKTKEGFKTHIIHRNTGQIELNGTGDFLVRFNDLEKWVKNEVSKFNGHSHLYNPGSLAPIQTAGVVASISTDITDAKAETLETKSSTNN